MTSQPAGSERYPVAGGAVEVAGHTDRGTYRSENQDRIAHGVGAGGVALVLADGMGGGVAGGEAAEAAVTAILPLLTAGAELADAVAAAGRAVAEVRPDLPRTMVGTTLVAAVAGPARLAVLNVGDSRAYLCGADGGLRRLTHDHSRTGELVAVGQLTWEEARRHPARNMLTRAVTGEPVEADISVVEWRSGDTLVLCSDGIWEPLDEPVALRIWTGPDLAGAAASTCRAALDAGSHDNVTVLLARLTAAG